MKAPVEVLNKTKDKEPDQKGRVDSTRHQWNTINTTFAHDSQAPSPMACCTIA